jgi:hypothetical protein
VCLAQRMRSSTRARRRWRSSSAADVRVRLVCEKASETVAVDVGEAELGAGMGALAADDQARPLGPARKLDGAGQLRHPGALALRSLGVDRLPQAKSGSARILPRTASVSS